MAYRFRWTCSYMGCVWYEVSGDGPTYSVEHRRMLSDYERAALSRSHENIETMVAFTIGKISREHRPDMPIRQDVVDALNAWRIAEWEDDARRIRAAPEIYGDAEQYLAECKPVPVIGIYLSADHSRWIENGEHDTSAKTAA